MDSTDIAKICHEANRAYCETLGDTSQSAWLLAEQWQRDSAVKGVEWRIANPDAPTSAQHDVWLQEKAADGWRYGPVKNPSAKQHPCMVPFDELPPAQQAKDALFAGIVNAFRNFLKK